mgnify:FL=1
MNAQPPFEPLLKAGDVARLLNVSRSTAFRLIESGAIPSVKLPGRLVRVRLADVRRLIEQATWKGENDKPRS